MLWQTVKHHHKDAHRQKSLVCQLWITIQMHWYLHYKWLKCSVLRLMNTDPTCLILSSPQMPTTSDNFGDQKNRFTRRFTAWLFPFCPFFRQKRALSVFSPSQNTSLAILVVLLILKQFGGLFFTNTMQVFLTRTFNVIRPFTCDDIGIFTFSLFLLL